MISLSRIILSLGCWTSKTVSVHFFARRMPTPFVPSELPDQKTFYILSLQPPHLRTGLGWTQHPLPLGLLEKATIESPPGGSPHNSSTTPTGTSCDKAAGTGPSGNHFDQSWEKNEERFFACGPPLDPNHNLEIQDLTHAAISRRQCKQHQGRF